MADETPTLDPTSTPTPIELDEPEGEWTTPGKVRKPRLAARPSFDLHAVCVHLPALPSATSAQLLDILPAFIRAAKLPAHTCADVSVHLRNRNRLAILKTHHIELARRLLSVASIILAGRIYAVAPYLAAPTNSCRGVIHGIAPDATQEELLRDLDSYQADILLARRMGNTNSALITFAGMHVPFCVYYQRLEFRCRPHKPRAHHCTICLQYGHRTGCAPLVPHPSASLMNHIPAHHGVFIVKAITLPLQKYAQFGCNGMKPAPTRPKSSASCTDSTGRVSPTPVIQPAPSAQPKPAEYHTPAPVKQYSPLQKPVHQLELGLTELTSRVTALTSLVEMQQARIEAQDQRTSNLETLISNRTQSLDNLNSTINKAFNDAPGPMEDKNHPFKRTHPTNWDLFRRLRVQKSTPNYDVWVDSLRRTRSQATTTTEANPPSDRADPHLMRLWRRRKRLLSRIPWLILRSLLGPQPAPLPTIQKHLSEHGATPLLQQVTDMYIPPPLPSLYPEYTGPSNSSLYSPFTLPDLERALAQNKTGTTPGVKFAHLSLWTCARPSIPYFMTLSSPPSKTPAVDLDSTVTFLLFSALDKLSSDSGPRCPRPSRSPAEHLKVEFTLQSGLNLISEFLSRSGMQAAPEKSELLLLSATKYQRSVNPLLNLTLAGTPIPSTSSCRVLGFPLQDHSFTRAIQSTITTCHQVTHLVRRVVKRRGGLDECRANQLSSCASIGIDNLAAYSALRRVIGYCSGLASGPLTLLCIPLNDVFPAISAGRRQARAHFHDPFPPDTVTCYVDAAYYQTRGSTACVTMPTPLGITITSTAGPFSLPTSSLSLELAAIIHATHELTLLPPSPRALRDNRLPDNLHEDLSDAFSLLSPALVTVVWVPGHAGIIGNKLARELAREINSRAPMIPWPCPPIADEAHFYKKTLKQHYKHLRHSFQTLPPPHHRLSTAQVRTLRAIQLNTLITPARLYLYRYRSDPSCPNCPSTYANVEHILFSCPAALQSPHYPNPPPPHWRVWLASAAFADQLAMVLVSFL
ncbi:hypothetical protein HPB49_008179 [Dermacentor silvarum]|uniref:Uncharacterized protein n=1 Tax=Dermacentor silvarum TaxID=543639 RepID=A0ACB8DX48_DERSI|nr:hypothetical protein HPB49_008179 [Dermacentor silvarum]